MLMHRFLFFYFLPFFCCEAVNSVRALTESLGQEVIEMDAPIKELPPEIEEEPSAENEADIRPITTTLSSSTKSTTTKDTRRKMKETEQTRSSQEEDEARIEKELSELYKDSADYKADSGEVSKGTDSTVTTSSTTTEDALKPIGRARNEFKFQPDTNNRADVERFRTSVDVISCDKNRLSGTTNRPTSAGHRLTSAAIALITSILFFN